MAYRTILVELAGDSGLEARLQTAQALARRFDAVLVGMHVMPPPFLPMADGGAVTHLAPELIEAQRKANQEVTERVQAIFRSICGTGPTAVWQEAEGGRGQLLAEAAHTTDLLLARRASPGGMDEPDVLDDLVTAAGIPVLALPPDVSGELGQTVPGGLERVARGHTRRP